MSFLKNLWKAEPTYGILVVGDPTVGKKWLHKIYCDLKGISIKEGSCKRTCAHVVPPPVEGMGASFEIVTVVGPKINIGHDKLSRCMAVIFCYDVFNRRSFNSLDKWIHVVERKNGGMLRYLASCKSDKTHFVEREEAEKFARDHRFESFTETSAVTKNGIEDLFESVMEDIHWKEQRKRMKSKRSQSTLTKYIGEGRDEGEPSRPDVKIVVVGDSGVGKTTFLKRFILEGGAIGDHHEKFQEEKMTFQTEKGNSVTLLLWDTNGAEGFQSITRAAYRGCSGVILLFDLSNRQTFADLILWVEELKTHCRATFKFLIGNKMDAKREVDFESGKNFGWVHDFAWYAETSSTSVSEQENILYMIADSFEPYLQQGVIKAPGATGIHLLEDSEDIEEESSLIQNLGSSIAPIVTDFGSSVAATVTDLGSSLTATARAVSASAYNSVVNTVSS